MSRKLLSLAAVAALALTGCGHAAISQTAAKASALGAKSAGMASLTVDGVSRKLGYNIERFQSEVAPKLNPVHFPHAATLPESVDNRQYCSPVANQGQLGSCTAFSMGKGLREYMQKQASGNVVPMSPLWLYYNERVHMGSQYVNQDSGANMADGMWVLNNQGCATEQSWPYDTSKFTQLPSPSADATAPAYKIKDTVSLASFDDVKAAIAAGKPVVFGFTVYLRFQFIGHSGIMPMPLPFEPAMGGHAVMAVGYNDKTGYLTVRNSWGSGWGDNGYFYMPYKFAQDSKKAMEWFTTNG